MEGNCEYLKNRIKRDIRKVKKIITRNEGYIEYYKKNIADGNVIDSTHQFLADNEAFLKSMQEELEKLETELIKHDSR